MTSVSIKIDGEQLQQIRDLNLGLELSLQTKIKLCIKAGLDEIKTNGVVLADPSKPAKTSKEKPEKKKVSGADIFANEEYQEKEHNQAAGHGWITNADRDAAARRELTALGIPISED